MKIERVVESYSYDRFGEILFILHKHNRKYLNDTFAEHNLNLVQAMCIFTLLEAKEITQQQLTEILHLTKSGITKAVNNLQKEGYIVKERSKTDNRKFIIKLTKKGESIVPTLIRIYEEWEEKIGLNEVDDEFMETLKKITSNAIKLNSENE